MLQDRDVKNEDLFGFLSRLPFIIIHLFAIKHSSVLVPTPATVSEVLEKISNILCSSCINKQYSRKGGIFHMLVSTR